MENIAIREVEIADIRAVADLVIGLHNLHVEALPKIYHVISFEEATHFIEEIMDAGNTNMYVATGDQTIVGFIFFEFVEMKRSIFSNALQFIHLRQIAVAKDYWRKGVGKRLISYMKLFCKKKYPTNTIIVEAWQFNSQAMSFYQDQGFQVLSERMGIEIE